MVCERTRPLMTQSGHGRIPTDPGSGAVPGVGLSRYDALS